MLGLNAYLRKWDLSEIRSENFDYIEYKISLTRVAIEELWLDTKEMTKNFKITIKHLGSHYLSYESEKAKVFEICEFLPEQDAVEVIIFLTKKTLFNIDFSKKYNVIVCSSLSWLEKNLKNFSLVQIEKSLFSSQKPAIIALMHGCESSIINDYIYIEDIENMKSFNTSKYADLSQPSGINEVIKREENVHWNDHSIKITPDYLYPLHGTESKNLNNILYYFFTQATLGYLAKYTVEGNDECLRSTFNGFKNITVKHSFETEGDLLETKKLKALFSFYKWVYTEKENIVDKVNLLQNIASIHLKEPANLNSFLYKIEEIRESTYENYKSYIEDSIDEFFSHRREFESLIQYTSEKIGDQITKVTSLLNKNMYGLVGAFIASVLSFTKGNNTNLLPYILYAYASFILIFTIYYTLFSKMDVNSRLKFHNVKREEFKKYFNDKRLDDLQGTMISDQLSIYTSVIITTWFINTFIISASITFGLFQQSDFLKELYNYLSIFIEVSF